MGHPTGHAPAYLIVGADPSLRAHAVSTVLEQVCGPDRMELIEAGPEADLDQLLTGVPLFTAYQVVLIRGKSLDPPVVRSLLRSLTVGNPTTILVISVEKLPPKLEKEPDELEKSPGEQKKQPADRKKATTDLGKAVQAAGGIVTDTTSKQAADTVRELLEKAPFDVDPAARQMIVQHVGEDPSLVLGLIETLHATYGDQVRLSTDQIAPYLSLTGGVPPWDLTDAIDERDPAKALHVLHRLLAHRDPLEVHAILNSHVNRLFQLANLGLSDEKKAAEALGVKGSTYPIKKALRKLPRWGDPEQALVLLATAGENLRGDSAQPRTALMQVLVGRLACRVF